MACATGSAAGEGKLALVERDQASNRSRIVGVAPNGTIGVRGEGPLQTTAAWTSVHENAYRMEGSNVDRLSFR
jgi:hypothetical protein